MREQYCVLVFLARRAASALVMAILAAAAFSVAAQGYPAKPLRMIVPFPPGGGTDILDRYLGLKLGEVLGQQFIIENRGGANGTLGLDVAAQAAPDGYTLVRETSLDPPFPLLPPVGGRTGYRARRAARPRAPHTFLRPCFEQRRVGLIWLCGRERCGSSSCRACCSTPPRCLRSW
jgi:tripartite-type tricarboxylate transporter receptor subunit TctC